MEFKGDRAIYLQIAEHVMENILAGKWRENDRIPSVRDMAMSLEVNPNTVVHSYNYMQDKGIIQNRRGVGYFVAGEAVEKVRGLEKEDFFQEQLPRVFKRMLLLGIGVDEIRSRFDAYEQEVARETAKEAEEKAGGAEGEA